MELVSTMEISGEEREIADAYARGKIDGVNSNLNQLNCLTGDKSILFNQLIPLFSSSNWAAEENASVSFENNVATVTNTVKNFGIKTIGKVKQIEQNIYYFSFELKTTSKLKVYFGWGESGASKIDAYENTGGVFKRFYALKKSGINSNSTVYIWAPEGIGTFSVKNAKVVNLTKMFGAGKEPTLKEFENLFPNDCYEQTNGIPISNIGIASSIERINESLSNQKKTTFVAGDISWAGAELADNNWKRCAYIKVTPNVTYTIKRSQTQILNVIGFKNNKTVITDGTVSPNKSSLVNSSALTEVTFTTTATTEYVRIAIRNNNLSENITLSNDGIGQTVVDLVDDVDSLKNDLSDCRKKSDITTNETLIGTFNGKNYYRKLFTGISGSGGSVTVNVGEKIEIYNYYGRAYTYGQSGASDVKYPIPNKNYYIDSQNASETSFQLTIPTSSDTRKVDLVIEYTKVDE